MTRIGRRGGFPVRGLLLCLCLVALVPGVTPASADTVLRIVPILDLRILDPYQNPNYGTRNHGHLIYETLFAPDSSGKLQPQMVGDWSVSQDRLVWRFTLRPGLNWHDGQPVTTADVIASLERLMSKDALGGKLRAALASLKAEDDRTFVLTLTQPFALVLDTLAKVSNYASFILPERFARMKDGDKAFEPIGSGPFVFRRDQWKPGVRVVYEKNKDYKPRSEPADGLAGGRVVKVDRVEGINMPDMNTAANALSAGEVDLLENVNFDVLPHLQGDKNLIISTTDPVGQQHYLRMNHLYPPFDNPKARQALLYIMDQDLYGQAVTGNKDYYKVCTAYMMCGSLYGSTAGAVKPDLEKARQLLAEAGYKGEKIVVLDPAQPSFGPPTQVTASQLRKIGVNVELQAMDFNSSVVRRSKKDPPEKGGWHLFHSGSFGVEVVSPMTSTYLASTCEQAAPGWPCDKELEALKDEFARTESLEGRKAVAEKIQLRAVESVPYVPVVQTATLMVRRKELSGVTTGIPFVVYWGVQKPGG